MTSGIVQKVRAENGVQCQMRARSKISNETTTPTRKVKGIIAVDAQRFQVLTPLEELKPYILFLFGHSMTTDASDGSSCVRAVAEVR